jgi:ribosomal protein S8
MFNIGGIFRGIGDSAESAVVQGRKNKHEKEQMNLRAELADKAASKARTQLLTDKLNQEKLDRKARYNDLLFMGFDDPIALAASRTKGAFESAKQDLTLMRELSKVDKKQRNINDAYTVAFKKSVKAPDFVKGTEPTINVQSVLAQMDKATTMEELSNIDFGDAVVKRNEMFFEPEKTNDEMIESLSSELLNSQLALKEAEKEKLTNPDAFESAEQNVAALTLKLKERIDVDKNNKAILSQLRGESIFEKGELQGYMKEVETLRKNEFDKLKDVLKAGKIPEGLNLNISLQNLENNFEFKDGTVRAKGAEKNMKQLEQILNYVTVQAVNTQAGIMDQEGAGSEKIAGLRNMYSHYTATVNPALLYTNNPFVPELLEDEIPTEDFMEFLEGKKGKEVKVKVGQNPTLDLNVTDALLELYRRKRLEYTGYGRN